MFIIFRYSANPEEKVVYFRTGMSDDLAKIYQLIDMFVNKVNSTCNNISFPDLNNDVEGVPSNATLLNKAVSLNLKKTILGLKDCCVSCTE